jgi:hypothetical protein
MTDQVNSIRLTDVDDAIIYVHPKSINQMKFNKNGLALRYQNVFLHREDGPAYESTSQKVWYMGGKPHRVDGPAHESSSQKIWYLNGEIHRIDGPAIEYANGNKEWRLHGKHHNEHGPAIELISGVSAKYWFLNGISYSFEDWKKEVAKLRQKTNSLDGKIATIDGKTYRLVEIN